MKKEKQQNSKGSKKSDTLRKDLPDKYEDMQAEEQSHFLASVIEQSSDGMAIADMQNTLIFVNKKWVSMHGYENAEELVGQKLNIFHTRKQLEEEVEIFNRMVNKEGYHTGEVGHVRKDGSIFPTQMTTTLLRNKNNIPIAYAGSATDITKRKQSEESLRESEIRYQTLYNLLPYGGEIINTKGEIINCSPSTARMLGYKVPELIGKHITELLDPESLDVFSKKFPKLLSGKPETAEIRMIRKNGKMLNILRAAQPILDKHGKVDAIMALNVDISERKKAELELKNKNKELKASIKRIRRINIELEKAREKAEESDRLKSAFLANMSHEIRTPMNGILGFAALLKNPKLTGEEHEMHIQIIEESGHRMLNIINNLIDISKIEAGQVDISISESKVNEQIEYIYSFFKHEAENKGLKISFKNSLPADASVIQTDREKIFAILTNLVKNAIKYTHEGAIEFGYKKKEDFLEFYVRDSGIGIAPEKQKVIFDRFVRADLSLSSQYEGAGLGLSITKAYVEMLGGKIWVKSKEQQGSQFYFTIPYTSPVCD